MVEQTGKQSMRRLLEVMMIGVLVYRCLRIEGKAPLKLLFLQGRFTHVAWYMEEIKIFYLTIGNLLTAFLYLGGLQ